ncbi:EamA family transporter [Ruegeria sp.]|uniref:EamA family transporter n=1 Tax=Ruegeria sp. TaxID=1879320 RepID=UPI003B001B1E
MLIVHRKDWQEITWGLSAGALMGLGWIGYVAALEKLPASTVGVLYMTYPVFTLVIAW